MQRETGHYQTATQPSTGQGVATDWWHFRSHSE